jgi:hypothetical protein
MTRAARSARRVPVKNDQNVKRPGASKDARGLERWLSVRQREESPG